MKDVYNFSGNVLKFDLGSSDRKYTVGVCRYGFLREFVRSEPFSAKTGKGEQRAVIKTHANSIKKAAKTNKYRPTAVTIGTRQDHRDSMAIENNVLSLDVSKASPLPLLDGGNRFAAFEMIREEGPEWQRKVDNLYVPYVLYLDGNALEDFIILQEHRPVSRDHMLSVRIASGLLDEKHAPYFAIAKDVAHKLHTTPDSFCHNLIKFDSSKSAKVGLPLSLNSLCGKSASDLACSLYGGAKIAASYEKDAEWLSECILTAYRALKDTDLLEENLILSPVPDGTKAGTSLVIAIGNMLAARLKLMGVDEPEDSDIELLVRCAIDNFDAPAKGNTSADRKRNLLNGFCTDFFEDLLMTEEDDMVEGDEIDVPEKVISSHEGIPIVLIRLLSSSTFNVSKLPTEHKKKGRKPKAVVATSVIEDESDMELEIDTAIVDNEDPIDSAAFEEDDEKSKDSLQRLEAAAMLDDDNDIPWDN